MISSSYGNDFEGRWKHTCGLLAVRLTIDEEPDLKYQDQSTLLVEALRRLNREKAAKARHEECEPQKAEQDTSENHL